MEGDRTQVGAQDVYFMNRMFKLYDFFYWILKLYIKNLYHGTSFPMSCAAAQVTPVSALPVHTVEVCG